jgi:rubrerythrin
MDSIKGTKTEQNLLKSFAGESQARNRYEFFAKQAKKEGFEQISAIFMDTANQEQQHAKTFFRFLEGGEVEITATYPAGKIGTTSENLKDAAIGENEEWTELYPEFAKVAKEEGLNEIANAFTQIAKVEKTHEDRYLKLLKNIEDGKVFKKDKKVAWKCRKCGFEHEGENAPQKCPACSHPQGYFEIKADNY